MTPSDTSRRARTRLSNQYDVDVRMIPDDAGVDEPTVFGRENERAGLYQLLAESFPSLLPCLIRPINL